MKKVLICSPIDEVPNYVAAVKEIGMEPVASTPTEDELDIGDFAGLILPGGPDMDPTFYGQEDYACRRVRRWLDLAQLHALDVFVKSKKPVLAICKGAQVVNVYFGGTLFQNLPTREHHQAYHVNNERLFSHHPVRILPGTPLSDIWKTDEIIVNSAHHQGVDRVAEDLKICAYSDDGVVEGLYHQDLPLLAVQWHPERMAYAHYVDGWSDGSLIFEYFKAQMENK
ncbi:MAG: gamma-glutamyl-gamma-aminobutyrate hydrolase family protein [Clostridiales bacterium]|nr:gamma-glutamyl-gamma-aminobutyrate hydrolase family protein [Clostridiales bacterium]